MARRRKTWGLFIIAIVTAVALLVIGYRQDHRPYVYQQVYKTCNGKVIPAANLHNIAGPNPGGPCLADGPFILKNDARLYDFSLVLIGIIIGSGLTLVFADTKSSTKKSKRPKRA